MHELIAKYLDGSITTAEIKDLEKLIDTDESVKKEFVYLQNIYALSSTLPRVTDAIDAKSGYRRFRRKRLRKSITIQLVSLSKYAAVLIIALFISGLYFSSREEKTILIEEPITYEEFSTPAGQRAMLKLHDGSVVWLNARSSLRYPNRFTDGKRQVELEGEAYFDVRHNESLPFIVSAGDLEIKVKGTKFNVFAYKEYGEFSTYLLDGSVEVSQKGKKPQQVRMEPNELLQQVNGDLQKKSFTNTDFLLWKEGIYAFDDLPFAEIIKKLELYYDVKIIIQNNELAQYKLSGKFRQRDGVVRALTMLQKVRSFRFYKNDELNVIRIT